MKQVIIILLLAVLVVSYKEPVKERYFFVCFAAQDEDSNIIHGSLTITTDGSFLNQQQAIGSVKHQTPEADSSQIAITGLYEFKNKAEMDYFYTK
jgi:hypothetical protein